MKHTPKGYRLHIGIFGRRNVGKSSLLNAITRQRVSIVSDRAGTTTDPVEKPMELLPLGPVLFIDTAGVDDRGALGALRVDRTRQVLNRTDIGVLVTAGYWGEFEEQLLAELTTRAVPTVVVFNKRDLVAPPPQLLNKLAHADVRVVHTTATSLAGISDFRQALLDSAPDGFIDNPVILRDLVGPNELAVLVVPVDKEAPRGRLILPQAQSIRDLLDGHAMSLVVQDTELAAALKHLKHPPRLVVTDSQAFRQVAKAVPPDVLLTSFSILFSRFKGDLLTQVAGTLAIEELLPGDRILVAEACSHHPIEDDIGRVKIPRWLREYVGGELHFDTVQGHDFPAELAPYRLVIHCGACMLNRREVLNRILQCRLQNVPITNYGLAISYSLGIFERALEPFPAALELLRMQALHLPPAETLQGSGRTTAADPEAVAGRPADGR